MVEVPINRDVEQRRAEWAQRTAEAKASAILRAGPDLMFVLSPDGTYLDYHAAHPEHLYAPPDRFIGRNIREIMPPDLTARFLDALARARDSAEPIVVEYALPLSGEERHYETRLVPDERGHIISIVRDVTDRRRAELALGQSEAVLRTVRDRNKDLAGRLIASQEGERRRLARELHDDLSQKLALLAIRVDQLEQTTVMSESLALAFREISEQTRDVASDVHRVSHQLHPFKLEALGLAVALESVCTEMWRQYGVKVEFTHSDVPADLDADVALCIYRIAQESLRNVVKHSGAPRAAVRLSREGDELELQSTADRDSAGDRRAQRPRPIIRERASFAGRIAIHSKPGAGTTINLRVPIRPCARTSSRNRPPLGLIAPSLRVWWIVWRSAGDRGAWLLHDGRTSFDAGPAAGIPGAHAGVRATSDAEAMAGWRVTPDRCSRGC